MQSEYLGVGICFSSLQCQSPPESKSVQGASLCNVNCNVASMSVTQMHSNNTRHEYCDFPAPDRY